MRKIIIPIIALLISATSCYSQLRDERKLSHFTGVKTGGSFDVYLKKGHEEKVVIEAESGPIEDIRTEVNGNTLHIYMKDHWGNIRFDDVNIYVTFRELEKISGSGSGSVTLESPLKSDNLYLSSGGSGNFYCRENLEAGGNVEIVNSGSGNFEIEAPVMAVSNVSIRNSGSGNMFIEELNADNLSVHNSGSGNLEVNGGEVDRQSIALSGSGDFKAENLVSNVCRVKSSGSSSVYVNVREELVGNSSGSGNVYIKGRSARLDFSSSGSGKIKHMD